MNLPLAFLSDRDAWEIMQKREEIQFVAYAIISAASAVLLVRWKLWSFYLVAPVLTLVSLLIFCRLVAAVEVDREWYRGYPTARYFVAGSVAIIVPVVLCGLMFLLRRNGDRTSGLRTTPVESSAPQITPNSRRA